MKPSGSEKLTFPGWKNRLIQIISILLIIGFFATSFASYFVSRSSLRTHIIQNELPLTSDNIYSEIQRDLLRPIFISSLMATDTFLRDWVLHGENEVEQVTRYLKEIQVEYNTFTSYFISDITRTYYHSDGILKEIDEDDPRDIWYFRVKGLSDDYEINVDPDQANKDAMTIFINYRVYDYDDNYVGVTGVGLQVSAVKDLIKEYQQNYGRRIYFVDESGEVMLHGSDFPEKAQNLSHLPGVNEYSTEILQQDYNTLHFRYDNKTVYLNTRFIPEFSWFLIVEQTDDQGTKQILNTLLVNLIICLIVTIIVLMLVSVTVKSYQKKLENLATLDKLTSIYNRQAFDIILSQTMTEFQRNQLPFSLIMLDIDHFKEVNDKYGHVIGDFVLQQIVKLVRELIRGSDVFCRWGGEEFIILLKDCHIEHAAKMAEKIRDAIEKQAIIVSENSISITVSAGVVQPDIEEDVKQLIIRADTHLYDAKNQGRNRIVRQEHN